MTLSIDSVAPRLYLENAARGEELFSTVGQVLGHLAPGEKLAFGILLAARLLSHALDILGLGLLALFAAALTQSEAPVITVPILGAQIDLREDNQTLVAIALIGAIFLAKSMIGALLLRVTTGFLSRLDAKHSEKILAHFFSGNLDHFSSLSKGEMNWAVMKSSQNAFGVLLFAFGSFVTELGLFLAITVVLFALNPQTAGVLAGYFLFVSVVFLRLVGPRSRRLGARYEENSARGHEILEALSDGFRQIHVAGRAEALIEWLMAFRKQQAKDWGTQRFVSALPRYVVEVALVGGVALLVTYQILSGGSDRFVDLGVFLVGGLRLMAALLPVQNAVTEMRIWAPQGERALEILDDAGRSNGAIQSTSTGGQASQNMHLSSPVHPTGLPLEVKGVSYSYNGSSGDTLSDVTLSIPSGQFHVLVGPSGAGKSTLIDVLSGMRVATRGSASINGEPCSDFVQRNPGMLAFVPQQPSLIPGTILTNISLGWGEDTQTVARAQRALEEAGLWEVVSALPLGIHELMAHQLDNLSGGQLQRLAIARALFTSPGFLILDEPTSALDVRTESHVHETILRLSGKTTVLVVTHKKVTMELSDRVHFLESGRLTISGSYEELREKSPSFRKYLRLPPAER